MESELSVKELRELVRRQKEMLDQKDRQISHLTRNAQKWVQKFDLHQNNVAESVIKKFEMEFEHERNELHAKLLRTTELNKTLMDRLTKSLHANKAAAATDLSNGSSNGSHLKVVEEEPEDTLDINLMVEPASITEIEFSNEMIAQLEKYRDR